MEIKEIHFIIVTFTAIALLCFFYEGSMTGNIVKQAYCNDKGCYSFCEKTSDCTSMEVCCFNEQENGICVYQEDCQKLFDTKERNSAGLASFVIDKKYMDTFKKQEIYIYLLAGVAVIVILFLLFGKKHQEANQTQHKDPTQLKQVKIQPKPVIRQSHTLPVIKRRGSLMSLFRK